MRETLAISYKDLFIFLYTQLIHTHGYLYIIFLGHEMINHGVIILISGGLELILPLSLIIVDGALVIYKCSIRQLVPDKFKDLNKIHHALGLSNSFLFAIWE